VVPAVENMIIYSPDLLSYLRWQGSVAPHALKWAIPASVLTLLYRLVLHWVGIAEWSQILPPPTVSETTAWALFTSVLGFLVVFRAQLAYHRYWQGVQLVEQACSVWLNGCSNLVAFCSGDTSKQAEVKNFQFLLSRLMSLLLCLSMCDISGLQNEAFPCLDLEGIDRGSLAYLDKVNSANSQQKVVLQWMQRLVVENSRTGVIDIAPPILSRVFQEFSIGIVHFVNANKLTTVPFPFPFAQMVWMMICFFSIFPVPAVCALYLPVHKSVFYTFLCVFVFWSIHFIAVEIEMPFGEDPNDLPIGKINDDFNRALTKLLEKQAQTTPKLLLDPDFTLRASVCKQTQYFQFGDVDAPEPAPPTMRAAVAATAVAIDGNDMGPGDSEGSAAPPRSASCSSALVRWVCGCRRRSADTDSSDPRAGGSRFPGGPGAPPRVSGRFSAAPGADWASSASRVGGAGLSPRGGCDGGAAIDTAGDSLGGEASPRLSFRVEDDTQGGAPPGPERIGDNVQGGSGLRGLDAAAELPAGATFGSDLAGAERENAAGVVLAWPPGEGNAGYIRV